MKQDARTLSAQAVVLHHMKEALNRGDLKAMEGHKLVLQAILDWTEKNT